MSLRDGRDQVYLIQAGASADLPAAPTVEVFRDNADLPEYHRLALRGCAALPR